jgi:hypothetical protein
MKIDASLAALAMAIADVLAGEQLKTMAVFKLLQSKGIITEDEMNSAIRLSFSTPPGSVAEIADSIANTLKTRTVVRFQEMALHLGETSQTQ